jgi:hypothetical protein
MELIPNGCKKILLQGTLEEKVSINLPPDHELKKKNLI